MGNPLEYPANVVQGPKHGVISAIQVNYASTLAQTAVKPTGNHQARTCAAVKT